MQEFNFFVAGFSPAFDWDADRFSMTLPSVGSRQSHFNHHRFEGPNLGTAAFSRFARAACGGFRCGRTTATFDILYRLQITNFGLPKSTPNGLNYMDIPRLFPHDRCRLPDSLLLANSCWPCQSKKQTVSTIGTGLGERLDILAKML